MATNVNYSLWIFWALAFIIECNAFAQTNYPPGLPSGTGCDMSGTSPYIRINGVGHEGQGAAIEVADINRNGKEDIVLMAYDNPAGDNTFRYRIGWDVNYSTGIPISWSPYFIITAGAGMEGNGAGCEIVDIDKNGIVDMVLMAYDDPPGANRFMYKIGWNLQANGQATSWSHFHIVNGVGNVGKGAGISIADINRNGELDMLLMAYDSVPGTNRFRYRIGWDLNTSGLTPNWSAQTTVSGVSGNADGADCEIADIDLDGNLDLVLIAYDNTKNANNYKYRVGWNLQTNGRVEDWSRYFVLKGVGTVGQGAGISHSVYNQNNTSVPVMIFMAYDAPTGMNNFRYFVLPVTTSGTCFGYADDPPPHANNTLSVPTNWDNSTGTRLFNLNMREVQKTAQDALGLYIFGCFLAHVLGEDPAACWIDYPDSDVKCDYVYSHSDFSEKIGPDILVAAVAFYVNGYMKWVSDDINSYVLNTIHGLGYFSGAEQMPAYYTVHYTNPSLHPNLITQLNAHNPDWGMAYNSGKLYHGDCEDFAILRHALLRSLGFNRNFIWNAREPGHEFNIVLYKGAYRIMDYGPIYNYLCNPGHQGLNAVWNQRYGPRLSANTKTWLHDHVLYRRYPDLCGSGYGSLFSRALRPDLKTRRQCNCL